MKKVLLLWITVLSLTILPTGCGAPEDKAPPATSEPSSVVTGTAETTPAATAPTLEKPEAESFPEGDASSYYINVAYAEQIARYHPALSEKWNEEEYLDNGMSEVLAAYYEGNPLSNVGFGFVDLDNDDRWELVIGAIQDAEAYPSVFEIWTLVDGQPVMLAQAGAKNQYALKYVEEDSMWYVAHESSYSIFKNGTYYLMLSEGKFEVIQGIIFDASTDEKNPWFMTYDMDWDVSNDDPIDEELAGAILESNRKFYTALEYIPYTAY